MSEKPMTTTEIKPTKEIAQKVLMTVDCGLSSGLGQQKPGEMCVEAAVCYAFDLPHGDQPPCVSAAVRSFKIALNDCSWSSPAARAKGMRKLAIAQLGSNTISQVEFAKIVALKTTQRILPIALRAAAKLADEKHKAILLDHAEKCEKVTDLNAARAASDAARAASDAARAASYAASYAASDAARAASYAALAKDEVLTICAEIGLEALIELKSPGCEWLDLCA